MDFYTLVIQFFYWIHTRWTENFNMTINFIALVYFIYQDVKGGPFLSSFLGWSLKEREHWWKISPFLKWSIVPLMHDIQKEGVKANFVTFSPKPTEGIRSLRLKGCSRECPWRKELECYGISLLLPMGKGRRLFSPCVKSGGRSWCVSPGFQRPSELVIKSHRKK